MGYYSDVALAVKKTDYDKFIESASEETKAKLFFVSIKDKFGNEIDVIKRPKISNLTLHYYGGEKEVDIVIISWVSIKWNEFHGATKEIADWFRNLDDYEFARSGEERGDLEEKYRHKEGEYWNVVETYQGVSVHWEG